MEGNQDIADQLFILNDATVEHLFKLGTDAFTLYSFYYKTAKWQNTNKPWATNEYVMEKLSWGLPRVRATKKLLTENGFIEQDKIADETGKIKRWVIKLKYIQSTSEEKPPVENQQVDTGSATREFLPPVDKKNHIYTSNDNISNNNIKNIYNNNSLSSKPDVFDAKAIDLWNSIAEKYKLAKVMMITPNRHKALLARMKEVGIQDLDEFFAKIKQAIKESTFLRGRVLVKTNEGYEARNKEWRCSFDFFILQPSSLLKALEGAYADPDLVTR